MRVTRQAAIATHAGTHGREPKLTPLTPTGLVTGRKRPEQERTR